MHYDTAFLWLDTQGAIGQKWAYSGRFGSWRREPEALVLVGEHDEESNLGSFGLRQATLITEGNLKLESAFDFAEEWIDDCITAVRGLPIVRKIFIKITDLQPLNSDVERAKIQDSMLRRFPGIDQLSSVSGAVLNSGVSFNSATTTPSGVRLETMMLGVLKPEQRPNQLLRTLKTDGESGDFGYIADLSEEHELRSSDARSHLKELRRHMKSVTQHVRSRVIIPVVTDA